MKFTFRPIDNWPRQKNKRPKDSPFRSRYSQTTDLLERELDMIGASKVVLQIDLPESQIRTDGLPYSKARTIFQGVIVSFESKHGPLKYLTDSFNDWQENIRAIALGLEALRKVDRYGITKRGEQYTGWKQLPAAVSEKEFESDRHAADFISKHSGVPVDEILDDKEIAKKAYWTAAKKLHTDKEGGDKVLFGLLVKAKELLTS